MRRHSELPTLGTSPVRSNGCCEAMSLEWFGQQVVGRGQKIDHVCFLVVRFQRLAAGPLFVKHEPVRILQVAEHRVSACQCLTRGYLVSSGLMV